MKNALRVILPIALVLGAVWLASLFVSPQASTWYASLAKPAIAPPVSSFALAWIGTYVLMALALARVWSVKKPRGKHTWSFAFGTQLVLNVFWSILFFAMHALLFSVIAVVVLWFIVVIVTLSSYEIDRFTFWLLVPYLAWITFLMILTIAIWWIS